jgi:hypothetical protein
MSNTKDGVALMREAGEVIASIQINSEGVEKAVRDVAHSVKGDMPDGLTDIKGRFSGVEEPETPGAAVMFIWSDMLPVPVTGSASDIWGAA